MTEDAGSVAASIRLDLEVLEQDVNKANDMIAANTKRFSEHGKNAGEAFVQGYDKNSKRINNSLNAFVSHLKKISPQAGIVGQKIATAFGGAVSSGIGKATLAVAGFGAAFAAATAGVTLVIGAIVKVWTMLTGAVERQREAQKKLHDNVSKMNDLYAAVGDTASIAAPKIRKLTKEEKAAKDEFDKSAKVVGTAQRELDKYTDSLDRAGKSIENYTAKERDRLFVLRENLKSAQANYEAMQRNKYNIESVAVSNEKLNKTQGLITASRLRGLISEMEAEKQRLDLSEQVINGINVEIQNYRRLNKDSSELEARLKDEIQTRNQLVKSMAERTRAQQDERIEAAKSLGVYTSELEVVQARLSLSNKRVDALMDEREQYKALGKDISEVDKELKKEIKTRNELTKKQKELTEKQVTLDDIRKESIQQVISVWTALANVQRQQVAEAIQALEEQANASLDRIRENSEAAQAEVEARLEATREMLEEEKNRQLEEAGFIEAVRSEDYDKQIAEARAANDQILAYKLTQKQKEMKINEDYNKKLKAAEAAAAAEQKALQERQAAEEKALQEQLARDKAALEYQSALNQWQLQMAQAAANVAEAIIKAFAQGGGVLGPVLAGIVVAGTAGQMAILAGNPPKAPSFDTGGIVPGNSWSGDKVPAMVNSGELILNRAQQNNIAGQLSNDGGKLEVIIELDSQQIGEAVMDKARKGLIRVPTRAVY